MNKRTNSLAITPALFLALLPLLSGCYIQARGVVRPPTMTVSATAPTPPLPPLPPSGTVVVSASSPSVEAGATSAATTDGGLNLGPGQDISIVVVTPPPLAPATAVVTAPAPRAGFIWVRGHYTWVNSRWVWQRARFIPRRANAIYVQPRYDATRRIWIPGHWETRRIRQSRVRPVPRPQDLLPIPTPSVSGRLAVPPPPRVSAGGNVRVNASASARVR